MGLEVNNKNNNNVHASGSSRRKYLPFAGLFQQKAIFFSCFLFCLFCIQKHYTYYFMQAVFIGQSVRVY